MRTVLRCKRLKMTDDKFGWSLSHRPPVWYEREGHALDAVALVLGVQNRRRGWTRLRCGVHGSPSVCRLVAPRRSAHSANCVFGTGEPAEQYLDSGGRSQRMDHSHVVEWRDADFGASPVASSNPLNAGRLTHQ